MGFLVDGFGYFLVQVPKVKSFSKFSPNVPSSFSFHSRHCWSGCDYGHSLRKNLNFLWARDKS